MGRIGGGGGILSLRVLLSYITLSILLHDTLPWGGQRTSHRLKKVSNLVPYIFMSPH